MSKTVKYGIIAFLIFLVFSIVVFIVAKNKENEENSKIAIMNDNKGVVIDIKSFIDEGTWFDITEEDKITLAMAAQTTITAKLKDYLKDNKIAIFFIYGGPFDSELNGNYIICTGFNENGKVKVLYPDDNFETEWTYSFEGVIEYATKVMMFDM